MKAIKFIGMMIAMLAMSVNFSSCSSDDDDPVSAYDDYYIECDAKGGGLDSSTLNTLKSELNISLSELSYELEGLDKDAAIYIFDSFVKSMKSEFSSGISGVEGTLKLIFYLKTVDGKKIKTSTLNVTNTGCTIS
ncbi:MAG: hypothetical protein E7099_10350 [Mediterranea massiliensis]|nr:hypothetical protein [Mediterranea massiliensis]